MTTREMNPFSAQRAASPDMFFGYSGQSLRQLGGWRLEEIAGCWLKSEDAIPSFWVVGERKLGKTSLLLRLENLLTRQNRPDASRLTVPLYINCRDIPTLSDFYRGVFERAVRTLAPEEGSSDRIDASRLTFLRPGATTRLNDFELLDHAIEDLGSLVAQLSPDTAPRARLILLIDDVAGPERPGWTATLFEHLRALLRGSPFPRSGATLRREDVALVIAADRVLETIDGAGRLLDLLEELPLRALDASEMASLIMKHCEGRHERQFLPHRIYRATAGHPWLVQFVMENIAGSSEKNMQEQEPDLDAIVKTRFRGLEGGTATFRHYLETLPERSVEILARLAVEDGSTVETLAARTGLPAGSVRKRLDQMLNLGIVFQTSVVDSETAQTQYYLGEIFKQWFLTHTGSRVLLSEIEKLRSDATREETKMQVLNAPFTLTLGVQPDVLLADGLYTRLLPLKNDLSKTLKNVAKLIRNEGQKDILDIIADNLKDALQQTEWEQVWNDYVLKAPGQERDPRFVLRVGKEELFDFPIEVLSFNGQSLGLERPVYKELMEGKSELAYRLSSNLLPSEKALNVLVVGSGRGGTYDDRRYPDLPRVADEIADVCRVLLADAPGRRLKIGRIVALVDVEENLPSGVQKEALSVTNLTKALRGEMGVFHLFHYCGHYIPNRQNTAGGFLLQDGQSLKLFNLVEWRNALVQTTLRFLCLCACGSGVHVQSDNLHHLGAAHAALTTGVPVVIGMRWSIRDSQAQDFSRVFYPWLMKSGVPEVALFETRRELLAMDSASTLWAAPVMVTR